MSLFREHLAAYSPGAPELVLLHGWASHSGIWRSLVPGLRKHFSVTLIDLPGFGNSAALAPGADVDAVLEALLPQLPERAVYCGWSLGGMLATQIAQRYPARVQALLTLASNARFVESQDWPWAMAAGDYQAFRQLVERSAEKGLRRFGLLQCHGDDNAALVAGKLAGAARLVSPEVLQQGLDWLTAIDNRQALAELQCPVVHVFGERDALVGASAAEAFGQAYPQQRVECVAGAGHLPFLSSPEHFLAVVGDLAVQCAERESVAVSRLDKSEVRRSFSRAAQDYDQSAQLQRTVADCLLSHLPENIAAPLMDLGCGTGYSLPALQARSEAPVLALDLAEGMLQQASLGLEESCQWLCADAEDLPLADAAVGGIYSSLAVQWCENLPALFCEIERVLKPGGVAVIATLGPETLCELRAAWRAIDDFVHVNDFASRDSVAEAISYAGLETERWQEAMEVVRYPKLTGLTRDLKGIGAHNVNAGRPGGLTGRARLRELTQAYEQFRDADELLPASYQVWYLRLRKPAQ